jgi:hypothetical protein
MKTLPKLFLASLLIVAVIFSCKKKEENTSYITENVIVVIVDGARYSETWGDTSHQNIPNLAGPMAKTGLVNTQFYNMGPTYTLAGHTSITTGYYQEINNSGNELPRYPSFFQYLNATKKINKTLSWVIASKDKLEILSNCQNCKFKDKFRPSADCGISGLGSGYRDDSITCKAVIHVLSEYHPKLILVNFKEPDYSAHFNGWESYLQGIKSTDAYVYKIWNYIKNDSYYSGKTTMFVTNDHGRHLDSIADGFVSHGDACSGCRHISLYAFGPDFKNGAIINQKRELVDLNATVSELLNLDMEYGKGHVMYELFK